MKPEIVNAMWTKRPKENRKEFLMNSFVHLPIGLLVGFSVGTIVVKLVGIEIGFAKIIIVFVFALLICVGNVFANYRRLVKKRQEGEEAD